MARCAWEQGGWVVVVVVGVVLVVLVVLVVVPAALSH